MTSNQINMREQQCDFCKEKFVAGEYCENIGATYADGSRENLFAHKKCIEAALKEYRLNNIINLNNSHMDVPTFEHDTSRAVATIKQTAELINMPGCTGESKDRYVEVINLRANELNKMLDDSYKQLRKMDQYAEAFKMCLDYFEKNNLSNSVIAISLNKIINRK